MVSIAAWTPAFLESQRPMAKPLMMMGIDNDSGEMSMEDWGAVERARISGIPSFRGGRDFDGHRMLTESERGECKQAKKLGIKGEGSYVPIVDVSYRTAGENVELKMESLCIRKKKINDGLMLLRNADMSSRRTLQYY